jgi:hypothetical protein
VSYDVTVPLCALPAGAGDSVWVYAYQGNTLMTATQMFPDTWWINWAAILCTSTLSDNIVVISYGRAMLGSSSASVSVRQCGCQ